MSRKRLLSFFLVISLLLQPFVPVFAANDNSDSIAKAQEEFQKSYDQIMAIEEVDVGGFGSFCVGATSGFSNVGKWFANGWDNLFNGGKNQQEYVDYIKDIEDANAKIRQAKADARKMKESFDQGKVEDAKNADPSKLVKGGLAAQASAMNTLRNTLNTAGNALVEVGELCETIATVVSVVKVVLMGVSVAFPPSAPFLATPIAVMGPVSSALGIAGPIISAAGESLIESAEAGYTSDAQLLGNMAINVGTEGAKQAATSLLSKGTEKMLGDTAEVLAKNYGANADELLGTMTDAWNPKGAIKKYTASQLLTELGPKFATDAGKEFADEAADVGVDLFMDFTGTSIPSPKSVVEDTAESLLDLGAEHIKNKTVRQSAGLNVE